jgi:predicted metal-dependent enzyme (double-stranded beta helix superfamily)
MSYSFDQFCNETRDALKSDNGPDGHEIVRQNLENLLQNPDFISAECGANQEAGIRTIYQDADTGFNVLVHIYEAGKSGPPHDHGASWAVYGQVTEWTDMTVWTRKDDGATEGEADLEKESSFRIEPGKAGKFEVGDIHSIHFPDGSKFVRVTGTDLNAIPTNRFNAETKSVNVGSRL